MKRSLDNLKKWHAIHEHEISEREKRVGALNDLTGEERAKAVKEITDKCEAEVGKMKDIRDQLNVHITELEGQLVTGGAEVGALKTKVGGLETQVGDLEAKVKELERTIAEITENHDLLKIDKDELEGMIKKHDTAIHELNDKNLLDMKNALELHRVELDKKTKEHDIAMQAYVARGDTVSKAEHDKLVAEIADLKKQIQDMNTVNKTAVAASVEKGKKLEGTISTLQRVVAHEKKEFVASKQHDDMQTLVIQELRNETHKLHHDLDDMVRAVDGETKRTRGVMAGELGKLDKRINAGMDAQINVLKLIAILGNAADSERYNKFYGMIREANPTRETYTPSALFLMLESMAGTWKLVLRDGFTEVLVRKLVYDRRLWDTIKNVDKRTFYTSKYFRGFTTAFDLIPTNLDEDDTEKYDSDIDIDAAEVAGAVEEARVEEEAKVAAAGAGAGGGAVVVPVPSFSASGPARARSHKVP
jgi:hypothetical protein